MGRQLDPLTPDGRLHQLLEAETMQHIFLNNYQLCSEVSEPVLQHFVHLLATHGRHVQYLDFLHTVIKAEGKYVKKCQDMIMTEVRARWPRRGLGGGHRRGRPEGALGAGSGGPRRQAERSSDSGPDAHTVTLSLTDTSSLTGPRALSPGSRWRVVRGWGRGLWVGVRTMSCACCQAQHVAHSRYSVST